MFANSAAKLCGQSAVLLGWRPHEFWAVTPAELECVLAAMKRHVESYLDTQLGEAAQIRNPCQVSELPA